MCFSTDQSAPLSARWHRVIPTACLLPKGIAVHLPGTSYISPVRIVYRVVEGRFLVWATTVAVLSCHDSHAPRLALGVFAALTDLTPPAAHLFPEAYNAGTDLSFAKERVAVCDRPDTCLYSIGGNEESASNVLGRWCSERKRRAAATQGGKAVTAGEETPSRTNTGDFYLCINQGAEM